MIRWRPFITFEFFEPGEILLLTDGTNIDIYDYSEDSGSWVSTSDPERINLNKRCFYLDNYILLKEFK